MAREDYSRDLDLLSSSQWTSATLLNRHNPSNHPSLDLKLSIGIDPFEKPSSEAAKTNPRNIQALQLHTAEQMRLTAMEMAYAEKVKELTRREMKLAEEDFARARMVWEQATREVEKVERAKETATRKISATCAEITCRSCQRRFPL